MSVMKTVMRAIAGANSIAELSAFGGRCLVPDSGSSTLRRIHSVKSAGSTPTKKDAAPAPDRHDDQIDERGQAVADRPRALHERQRLAAMSGGKRFRNQRGAGRPLPAHAEAKQDAEDGELRHRLREAAGGGEDRIDQHGGHQRAFSSEPIGDDAERDAADRGGEQRERPEQAGGAGRQRECRIVDERGQHDRVEHHVERIEHPAERRGDERAPRSDVRLAPPREEAGHTLRRGRDALANLISVSSLKHFFSPWLHVDVCSKDGQRNPTHCRRSNRRQTAVLSAASTPVAANLKEATNLLPFEAVRG